MLPSSELGVLRAEIEVLEAILSIWRGDGRRAIACAQPVWEHLPAAHPNLLGQAGGFLAIALQMSGQPEAPAALLQTPRAAELDDEPGARLRLMTGVLYAQLAAAQFRELEQAGRPSAELAARTGHATVGAWIHYLLGRVYYEWNQLSAAREQFAAVVERRDQAHFYALQASLQGLALTYQALGAPREAIEIADRGLELALSTNGAEHEEVARAFRAHVALLQYDLPTATRLLPPTGPAATFQLPLAIEVPALTRAHLSVARATEADLMAAERSLAELLAVYEAHNDTLHVIQILAVQALAWRARGELPRALATLARAVELAAPGGLVRTFVDLGPPIASLLAELTRRPERRGYLSQLLSGFGSAPSPTVSVVPDREDGIVLVERLTDREIQVLQLAADHLQSKEIAARLHVSWQTVGKHLGNVYQKLQVSGRRQAVARAQQLGLIASDSGTRSVP
jgi:LuxR family maltose regulon positive regulatory protein